MDINQNLPILITGAASGLGAATAKYLSSYTSKLILLDKNPADQIIPCDITDENQIKSILDGLVEVPRVCINCAGIFQSKKIIYASSDEFKKLLDINLTANFNLIKLLAIKMRELEAANQDGERGIFINTSSIAALEGQVGQAAYSASKGAIVSMTLPLAREFAPYGIRVMTIAPGVMNTPIMSKMREDVKETLISDVVFPKRLGNPLEFAMLVKHIIENSYLNGTVIRLDGGLRME